LSCAVDELGFVGGDGEADALETAAAGGDGGVDADDVAVEFTSGPPLLPGLIGASTWMKSS
jgi:hypothetical protein